MNILPAQEIKRRGVKAIELALKDGPVHIIKNNSPACVVLTEAQYTLLTRSTHSESAKKSSVFDWILSRKVSGDKTKAELDLRLAAERDEWNR